MLEGGIVVLVIGSKRGWSVVQRFIYASIAMTDNRKACEEMVDALLEELSTRIGLSRLRAEKDATHHGSQENLKVGMKPGLKAKLSSTAWLQSSDKQSRAGREMGRGAKKGDSPENKCGDQEKV